MHALVQASPFDISDTTAQSVDLVFQDTISSITVQVMFVIHEMLERYLYIQMQAVASTSSLPSIAGNTIEPSTAPVRNNQLCNTYNIHLLLIASIGSANYGLYPSFAS